MCFLWVCLYQSAYLKDETDQQHYHINADASTNTAIIIIIIIISPYRMVHTILHVVNASMDQVTLREKRESVWPLMPTRAIEDVTSHKVVHMSKISANHPVCKEFF
ncbi:hypothetical protein CAPTEDRAFT_193227 [Capitella teleta]|uniref:Uncharacterized protein n=1 Tax=Capitella teleta TaxID=283909 RepID=R7UGV8_CAPTE|nr:hypothetical protein CAPTEDRAFT_193227 [Capitella teleta]|eukprot:ELU05779.1 hypothetical protein CAPTEDRAFT_193227 [Capitella teleta]